jgi:serine/threonine-protein kinase
MERVTTAAPRRLLLIWGLVGASCDNTATRSDLAVTSDLAATTDLGASRDHGAPDLSSPPDLAPRHDLNASGDLRGRTDLALPLDLAAPDLGTTTAAPDLSVPDLSVPDLSVPDLSVPPVPDLAGRDLGPVMAQPALQTQSLYFPAGAPWYRDVTGAATTTDSNAITTWMVNNAPPNGWGGGTMQVDFSIVAVDVPANTVKRTWQMANGYYYVPDCDTAPVPVPAGGAVEQTYGFPILFTSPFSGYDCAGFNNGDDCHMLFVARAEQRLYEIYHATIDSTNTFQGGCLAIWDLTSTDPNGRGQQCTSADAAGFPMAPLLFTAEEIAAGQINHAIRFILPNSMIRALTYVPPATHGTTAASGPATSGPYGFQMRLNPNYPVNNLSPAARVVARALQKYGMYLADGGTVALTAQSDVLSSVKWSAVGFDASSLAALKATDFDVIDNGAPVAVTNNCNRTQISQ